MEKSELVCHENYMDSFSSTFTDENNTSTPINTLWTIFMNKCSTGIDQYVPSKLTSTRFSQTWINRPIKRLDKRENRPYRRTRRSQQNSDWDANRNIQK
ncbi:hypothetical protein DPMN_192610 [Dreissena polymorpha]|uniref:Uncharacterized protein n=1 Tax=Dreissena polymorpha TaxID=45954 RepID=A0A9D3Y3I9_DREPO|nr:hypothetical protein DPMN_192610 [Dreissena polymorpha]